MSSEEWFEKTPIEINITGWTISTEEIFSLALTIELAAAGCVETKEASDPKPRLRCNHRTRKRSNHSYGVPKASSARFRRVSISDL